MLLMVCVLEPVHADIAEQLQVLYQEERKPKATLVLSHRSPQVLHSILHLVIRVLLRQVQLVAPKRLFQSGIYQITIIYEFKHIVFRQNISMVISQTCHQRDRRIRATEILAGIESERLVEHGIFLLGHLVVDIPIRYARLAHRVGLRASYQAHKRSKDAIHCIVEVEMAACKERVSIGQATSALGRRILVSVEYR